jgi:hypothetical protein
MDISKLPYLCAWTTYQDGRTELTDFNGKVIERSEPVVVPPPPPKPTVRKLNCKRCNASWVPRGKKLPMQCPKCKSPYWNKKRQKKPKKKAVDK